LTPTVAMGTAIKHPVSDRVKPSFVIFDIRAILTLRAEHQSARKSSDGLTRSGTGCYSCTHGNSGRQRVNCL